MSYTDEQKQVLREELLLPAYSSLTDQQAADALLVKDKERIRTSMTRQEVYENIDPVELSVLTDVHLAQINLSLSDTLDPFGNAVAVFMSVFGGGSATLTALASARTETVSRLVEIGLGEIENISLVGW
ncbi:hypothetical protein IIB79_00370, partial [candidate division KSB1 bacterium]|nr:hypothetical protein [candidate division KSB1 bacterium]